MSFLFQSFNERERVARLTFIGLLLSACVMQLPVFAFAQDPPAEPVEVALAAAEVQDEVEIEEGEVVAAAQVVGVMGADSDRMTAAKRFQLTQIFQVEIEQVKQVCELDKKQVLKLRVGAKGAVKKLTAQWKKNSQGQMGQVQQAPNAAGDEGQQPEDGPEIEFKDADEIDEMTMQMVVMNGMGNPFKYDDPLEDRFWQTTLKNILTDSQFEDFEKFKQERNTAKKDAMINLVVSALTVELGLTEQQKGDLVEAIRPPMQKADISCFSFYEPFVMYYYASKADSRKLQKVLSPAQFQKWKIFVMPVKEIGQMMEMEDGGGGLGEEQNILNLLGTVIEAIAEGLESLLRVYSK